MASDDAYRAIKQTTTQGAEIEVKINSKEIAEAIATKVEQVTGLDCEAYTNQAGSIVVHDHTRAIARITPPLGVVDVTPVGGVFDGETVCIPLAAETIGGLREIANAMDEANMRATSTAAAHQPTTHAQRPARGAFFMPKNDNDHQYQGEAPPTRKGGVPEADTREASPHALPFAPTRANGS